MGVTAIILTSDTLYYPFTYCNKFSLRYFIRLPCYGLNKKSLRNLLRGRNSKINHCHYDSPKGYLVLGVQR